MILYFNKNIKLVEVLISLIASEMSLNFFLKKNIF